MLNPSEYIVSELKQMSDNFVGFKVLYAFDKIVNAHIVQISPREEFLENESLLKWEIEFIERFESIFEGVDLILTAPRSFHHMNCLMYSNLERNNVSSINKNTFAYPKYVIMIKANKKECGSKSFYDDSSYLNKDIYVW